MQNRRNERRLLLPDLQIRVRKQARGDNAPYVNCTPIDISFNGLAFSSSELQFELLQKIDIKLSVSGRTLEASAVVCHLEETGKATRYGILYIDINPPLEELFSLKTLSSSQVRELAENLADNAMKDHQSSAEQQELKKAQALLFDGVEAFKNRICQHIKNTVDNQGTPHQLDELFEFSADLSTVTVPMKSVDGESVSRQTVTPVLDPNKQVQFKMDNGRSFPTLIEFLQELSDTFELLLAKD